ncbi:glycosyltransferase family 1 protein [candidate division KSB1 bacterium]|nr:glycosyltransferase family 1 protein [candidate division KSB1 bacterium]
MKIAYFTEALPPVTDGVSNTLVHLIETLQSEKIDFHFYSAAKPDDRPWSDRVTKVVSVPFLLYSYYKVGLPYFDGIDSHLNEFKPDLIHVVSPTLLGIYGINMAKKRKIPVVSSYHTRFVSYFSYYKLQGLEKVGWTFLQWFYGQCAAVYAPSPSAKNELESYNINNVELWCRGINLDRFSPRYNEPALRRKIGIADETPIILFVGRLVREKDLDDVVAVNKILENRGLKFKQVFVGDGPMRSELESRLPNAYFAGYQHGDDLAKWYATADLFFFPSTTETFGNVILEAFASATPAVGVSKGGVQDIIHSGRDGFIARPNDPQDIADKVQILIENKDQRLAFAERAQKTALEYSWDTINLRLLSSYRNLVDKNKNMIYKSQAG